jgi:hypothetical protein
MSRRPPAMAAPRSASVRTMDRERPNRSCMACAAIRATVAAVITNSAVHNILASISKHLFVSSAARPCRRVRRSGTVPRSIVPGLLATLKPILCRERQLCNGVSLLDGPSLGTVSGRKISTQPPAVRSRRPVYCPRSFAIETPARSVVTKGLGVI